MEYLSTISVYTPVKAILMDFDGTISTLRYGWEEVMRPLMLEKIGQGTVSDELRQEVDTYIDESTGIQTIFQMKWLDARVQRGGGAAVDPWQYKAEYNRRLMERVDARKKALLSGQAKPEEYLIAGSIKFLSALRSQGVRVYIASGTDHPDVVAEADALGLLPYFKEIAGAPPEKENCSKEAVLRRLMNSHELIGDELAVIGDGKVEISLGKESRARTLGIASDERKRCGVNEEKRKRLIKAGADTLCGDFSDTGEILAWLGLA